MELPVSDVLQALTGVLAVFGVWYKIAQDTDRKIADARAAASGETDKIKSELAALRTTAISRQEHDQDIQQVKQEIRAFRDEVRDDIKSLNANLTARFDLIMQKIFENKD